jgi:hypothetical protein
MPHCIYINVSTQTVTREEMSDGFVLKAYHRLVASPIDVGMWLPNGDIIYVDGEGQYRKPPAAQFAIGGNVFLGNAVVVSISNTGNDCCPTSTVQSVASAVQFL